MRLRLVSDGSNLKVELITYFFRQFFPSGQVVIRRPVICRHGVRVKIALAKLADPGFEGHDVLSNSKESEDE